MTDARTPPIAVLGSLNMDLVLRVARAPAAGETVTGLGLARLAGGKGGNQAVAAARQGGRVRMVGCVGADADGVALVAALAADGIDVAGIGTDTAEPTGSALVMVEHGGQNRIVVVPGANARLAPSAAALDRWLQGARLLVLQLEVPLTTVLRAVEAAGRVGCPVLLNPSPVQALPDALWPQQGTLVVNESEAEALCGHGVGGVDAAARAALALLQRGVARAVVTLGAQGAVAAERGAGGRHEALWWQPACTVRPVDTTAAGDTFAGTLAVGLARGDPLATALVSATRAAALCVQQPGAQPSIPSAAAVAASPWPPAGQPLAGP